MESMIVAMVSNPNRHYTANYELLEFGKERFGFGKKGIVCMQAIHG